MNFARRKYLVRPFQYRLILYQACYFALLGGVAYFCGVAPLLDAVQDKSLSSGERVGSAEALIFLDRHVLPFAGPLILVLFAHSVFVSHRIAGPLHRFLAVWRSIAAGDLSMRVKIRARDYLKEEARIFDEALEGLRQRIAGLRARGRVLDQALEKLDSCLPEASASALQEARAAAAGLNASLDEFVLERSVSAEKIASLQSPPREAA